MLSYSRSFPLRHSSLMLCFSMTILLLSISSLGAQQNTPMRLVKIEIVGLERYQQEQIIAATGLQIGQAVDASMLDAAAQKLLSLGIFKSVRFRYRFDNNLMTVTFQVEEAQGSFPVVFDNFVWFSDQELADAVRRELPVFDGTAPDTTGAINAITKALERLLQDRNIPAHVEYMPSANQAGGNVQHVFSAAGLSIPICAVNFPGASSGAESELVKRSKPLLNIEYSRQFITEFIKVNLIPAYRQRGYLLAKFAAPQPKVEPSSASGCKGVSLALPVEEGVGYNWAGMEISGNAALATAELESALGMRSGEVADGLKIDKGLEAMMAAYGRKGYVDARVKASPTFDDAARRVNYHMEITEGPQYHMGELTVIGLSAGDEQRLRDRWKLKPGDIYDASYLDDFVKKVVIQGRMFSGRSSTVEMGARPNRQNLTVNVTIKFK